MNPTSENRSKARQSSLFDGIYNNQQWKDVEDCVNNYIHANLPTQPNVKNNEKPKKPFAISEVEEYDETAELLKLIPESDFMKQFENLSLSLNASYDQYEPNIDDLFNLDFIHIPAPDPSRNLEIYDPIQDMIDEDLKKYQKSFETVLAKNEQYLKSKDEDEFKMKVSNQISVQLPTVDDQVTFVPLYPSIPQLSESTKNISLNHDSSLGNTKERKILYSQDNVNFKRPKNAISVNQSYESPITPDDNIKIQKGRNNHDERIPTFLSPIKWNENFVNTKPRKVIHSYTINSSSFVNLRKKEKSNENQSFCSPHTPYKVQLSNDMETPEKSLMKASSTKICKVADFDLTKDDKKKNSTNRVILKKASSVKVQLENKEKLICQKCGKEYKMKYFYQAHVLKCKN